MPYMQKRIKWNLDYSQGVKWRNGVSMLYSLSIKTVPGSLGELE